MTDSVSPGGLRERKRVATRFRIASTAARLAGDAGVAGVTVERIAAESEVSRATFFRYFETKETAIAEGFSTPHVDALLKGLVSQPADLGPLDALIATFREAGASTGGVARRMVAEQARVMAESSSLQAWVAAAYLRDEVLIAEVLADRLAVTDPDDPRPRLAAAAATAALRFGLERWLASGAEGDVSTWVIDALSQISLSGEC